MPGRSCSSICNIVIKTLNSCNSLCENCNCCEQTIYEQALFVIFMFNYFFYFLCTCYNSYIQPLKTILFLCVQMLYLIEKENEKKKSLTNKSININVNFFLVLILSYFIPAVPVPFEGKIFMEKLLKAILYFP